MRTRAYKHASLQTLSLSRGSCVWHRRRAFEREGASPGARDTLALSDAILRLTSIVVRAANHACLVNLGLMQVLPFIVNWGIPSYCEDPHPLRETKTFILSSFVVFILKHPSLI